MLRNRVNPNGLCHGCAGQAVSATPARAATASRPGPSVEAIPKVFSGRRGRPRASQSALKLAQVIGAFGMRCPSDSERRTRFVGDPGRPTTRGKGRASPEALAGVRPLSCRPPQGRAESLLVKAEGPVETDEVAADIQAGGTLFEELDDERELERGVDAVDVGAARSVAKGARGF